MKYKIAWSWRRVLKPGETTDEDGFAPATFDYVDGSTETVDVKGPVQAMSRGFSRPEDNRYAEIYVYETRNGELRILAHAKVV